MLNTGKYTLVTCRYFYISPKIGRETEETFFALSQDIFYRIYKKKIYVYTVSQKKWYLVEKRPYLPSNSSKMQNLGVFWKIQDICYQMGTEIFKIEEEMTEKTKPEVANPPSKNG